MSEAVSGESIPSRSEPRTRIAAAALCCVLSGGCGRIFHPPPEVSFSGTVAGGAGVESSLGAGRQITVCSLGRCSVSNAAGGWGFVVDGPDEFPGGDVVFTVAQSGRRTAVVVRGIRARVSSVIIQFLAREDGTVVPVFVAQDGNVTSGPLAGDGLVTR